MIVIFTRSLSVNLIVMFANLAKLVNCIVYTMACYVVLAMHLRPWLPCGILYNCIMSTCMRCSSCCFPFSGMTQHGYSSLSYLYSATVRIFFYALGVSTFLVPLPFLGLSPSNHPLILAVVLLVFCNLFVSLSLPHIFTSVTSLD